MTRFVFNTYPVGDFTLSEARCAVGDEFGVEFPVDTPTERMPAINVITAGRFSIGPFPDGHYVEMPQGHSAHLNSYRPAGRRTITCMDPDSVYLCMRPTDNGPYGTRRVELKAGEATVIKQGATFVAALGAFTVGAASKQSPLIMLAKSGELELLAITNFVGVEMWKL